MSVLGFHHHFKPLAATSPLQFQKQLRLQEARRLMLATREYKRFFGLPSMHRAEHLREGGRQGTERLEPWQSS